MGSIPGLGRSPGVGNGSPLQYSCLKNPMERGAWRASPQGHKESDTTESRREELKQKGRGERELFLLLLLLNRIQLKPIC